MPEALVCGLKVSIGKLLSHSVKLFFNPQGYSALSQLRPLLGKVALAKRARSSFKDI